MVEETAAASRIRRNLDMVPLKQTGGGCREPAARDRLKETQCGAMKGFLKFALVSGLAVAQDPPTLEPLMTVKAIEYVAVSESDEQALRGLMPFQPGDVVGRGEIGSAARAVREFDAYLTFKYMITDAAVSIRISGVGTTRAGVYIQEPQLVHRVEPEYPQDLRDRGVSGSVEIEATISSAGEVTETRQVSGDPQFAEPAREAVRQWRYRPAFADAQPVEVRRTVSFTFGESPAAKGKAVQRR